MQKYIDKGSELLIRSTVALDHLKNYIYVEADKEAHVREVLLCLKLTDCIISVFYSGFNPCLSFRLVKVYAPYLLRR